MSISIYPREHRQTVAELQSARLPHATCELLGIRIRVNEDAEDREAAEREAASILASIDEYLRQFTYVDDNKCPQCGVSLAGMFGAFTYGLAYGEGTCGACSYPCRCNHEADGVIWAMPLAYHPNELKEQA